MTKLRVFVTGHNSRVGGGISVAQNLIAAFGRVAPQHTYHFTIPPDLGYEECCKTVPNQTFTTYRHEGLIRRWLWETSTLPKIIGAFSPDVIFNLANRGLVSPPVPQSTFIQDSHLYYPYGNFGKISLLESLTHHYHRQHLRKSLKATQLLFCQTEVAEKRIKDLYGKNVVTAILPNQLSIFANSAAKESPRPASLANCENKFKLLVLTRYYAHKNLEVIPAIFERCREALRGVVVILTITPNDGTAAAQLLGRIQKSGLSDSIVTVGRLEQKELWAYYTYTDALFLPTLLESFSGTYIEAMNFGRPIITSDMDFAHAVCGEAALYADPTNVESLCKAILLLKGDNVLRNRLVEAGRKRLQQHSASWDDIGLNVIGNLEKLAQIQSKRRNAYHLLS
jgi:glycosyltransferase involved in cell wall biosynthesis